AESAAAVESAELTLLTDMRNMTQKLYAGEEITVADRIRCRRNQAWVTKLAVQAVEAHNASTGGYGLHLSNPVTRAWRDANAVGRHVSLKLGRGRDHVRSARLWPRAARAVLTAPIGSSNGRNRRMAEILGLG